jgi:hypothetical protein
MPLPVLSKPVTKRERFPQTQSSSDILTALKFWVVAEKAAARIENGRNNPPVSAMAHFSLAKAGLIPSLPVPCQESEEKQKHGKPLPSVSK